MAVIPPPGTSAYKAYQRTISSGSSKPSTVKERLTGTYNYPAKGAIESALDLVDKDKPKRGPDYSSMPDHIGGSRKSTPKNYYEAPLASMYGFGKTTAYQEALANTSYRREMDDMRKAGLNPSVIYGSHNSSGADSSIIPRSSGGGGGGGSGYRRGSGSSGRGLSKVAYYGIQLATTAVGALLGGSRGASIGSRLGQTASRLIGALKGR